MSSRAAALAVLALLLAMVAPGAWAGPVAHGPLPLTGYQEAADPTALIGAAAPALSAVGIDGTTLTASGHAVATIAPDALAQLWAARAAGRPASLLVSNWSDAIGDFSEPLAHRLLANPRAIDHVSAQLAQIDATQGWSGITVDLESLRARDRRGLTRFIASLRAALPSGATLDIDIMNAGTPAGLRAEGYDLSALAADADQLVLMAYDQHGSWENTPGPVGSLAWTRAGILAMEHSGVAPAQLTLGVAGYGYAWGPHANAQVSDAHARAEAAADGGPAHFDVAVGEWTATLANGTVLWWQDGRSLALRATLARRLGLAGLAIWDLRLADPLTATSPLAG